MLKNTIKPMNTGLFEIRADVADVVPMLNFSNIGRKKALKHYSFYGFADVADVEKKDI